MMDGIFRNCDSVMISSFGKNIEFGMTCCCVGVVSESMYFNDTHVGVIGMRLHFCQNADGTAHRGPVTISVGFFRCCRIDRRRLHSFGESGVNIISQVYATSQAFESCLDIIRILH
jgi:hypothetical protein